MEKLKEYAAVYTIGSVGYSLIEVLWRGFTHWTMAITGGVGFLLLYLTNLKMAGKELVHKCMAGCAILTSVELIVGVVVNRVYKMNVWDYSKLPGNFMGQVCPLYTALWFFLCIPVIPFSRLVREKIAPYFAEQEIAA